MRALLLTGCVVLFSMPHPVQAKEILESYVTHLSVNDHYNLSGVRLKSAAAIIRQDRANFHRFGIRDAADQSDKFFASKSNRAKMERMLEHGHAPRHIISEIINGTPVVRVNIYGHGNTGNAIEVILP